MKAKFYIAVFPAILLTGNFIQAQRYEHHNPGDKSTTIIVNNYFPDHDFYYSSRINRFHRSYSSFGYYAPVFTETYWYGYQPYSWGLSIYGGGGFGFGMGVRYNYPVYGYAYGYDPFYSNSYYMGYDPVFYYPWYVPVVFNAGVRHMRSSYYYGWRGNNYNRWDYSYRPVYNNYNYYNYYKGKPSQDYSSVNRPPSGRDNPAPGNNPRIDYSRRGVNYSSSSGTGNNPGSNIRNRSNNGLHSGETSRNTNPASAREQGNSANTPAGDNMHQGADNSRRSSERIRNSGNNSNNNSGTVNRGQTQDGVKAGSSRTPSSPRRGAGMSQGGSTNKSDKENTKSGSSSSSSSSSTGGKINRRR